MSFLAKLSQLKTQNNQNVRNSENEKETKKSDDPIDDELSSSIPKNYIREFDPAIQRLKEKRRQERMKNRASSVSTSKCRSKVGVGKNSTKSNTKDGNIFNSTTKWRLPKVTSSASSVMKPKVPLKKLSFNELMRQLDEKTKFSAQDESSSEFKKTEEVNLKNSKSNSTLRKTNATDHMTTKTMNFMNAKLSPVAQHNSKVMICSNTGLAKPNASLQKLVKKQKKLTRFKDEEMDWSEMDDFIDNDEEYNDNNYYREEIWSVFSNGHKPPGIYECDDDYDDMEANEFEVMEEEAYSSMVAKKEDKMEEEWLRKHQKEKKKKKKNLRV